MAFISYAQNFEDVMLARALADVAHGVYVDVGAQDPVDGSVTKHFYDHGWRGLNFEPSETYHARLCSERPEDKNLKCAVGSEPGTITFYELEGTGLSTIVEAVTRDFTTGRVEHTVPMTTLDAAYTEHGVEEVHFLKIDVEGAEDLVLRGTTFGAVRPWIVVVEATRPNKPMPYYEHWEPSLTDRGYHFVYADGLNRFYLADEHADRAKHFRLPPNYFDNFIVYGQDKAEKTLSHHLKIIDNLDEQLSKEKSNLSDHIAIIDRLGGQINQLGGQVANQHDEILRLIGMLEEGTRREKAVIDHHLGLVADAAARGEVQHQEIQRLFGLLEAAAQREKDGFAHYNGLLDQAKAHHGAQDVEIIHLRAVLGQAAAARDAGSTQNDALRTRIDALEAEVDRRGRQIEARDAKIGWLAQDRNRFRHRYERMTGSALWRLTNLMRPQTSQAAWAGALEPTVQDDPTDALPASGIAAAPTDVPIETRHEPPPAPAEQPEAVRWIMPTLTDGQPA